MSAEAKRRREAEERRDAIETELENNAGDGLASRRFPSEWLLPGPYNVCCSPTCTTLLSQRMTFPRLMNDGSHPTPLF